MYETNDDWFKCKKPVSWTSVLMSTHPVVFVTTIGKVGDKIVPGVAVIATCLDTSYRPPYVSFSTAVYQHLVNKMKTGGRRHTNTYLNIRQHRLFVVNLPSIELISKMDILARPYRREECKDKIEAAGLRKVEPFCLHRHHNVYPPLIGACLAHLECEVVDIHRPKGSDHYTVTGKVVSCSYSRRLEGERERPTIDDIRKNLAERTWHHFGRSQSGGERFLLTGMSQKVKTNLRFCLEKVG